MKTMCADVIRLKTDAGVIDPQQIFVPIEDVKDELRPVLALLRHWLKACDAGVNVYQATSALIEKYAKF